MSVSREHLAQNILPGLGLDRVRLATIRLPVNGGPLPGAVVGEYDAALRDYDAGRYREAIEKCRDVRYTVEKALDAKDRDGARVADQLLTRRLVSPRLRETIDAIWRGLADVTSEAHHPEDHSAFTPASARMTLLVTAVMIETISELLAPPQH